MADAVEANYDLCDYQFMEMLKEEAADCFAQGANIEGQEYVALLDAINAAMASRVSSAQQKLEKVLSRRDPRAMESEIAMMTRRHSSFSSCSFPP